ncbi:MAG: serine hydrolase [Bacteroidales bacterium]|nr:serine hydrolase [Candidatus Cryptobacteroides faecihippi]
MNWRIFIPLALTVSSLLLASCNGKEEGGSLDSVVVTVTDGANRSGKWTSSSDVAAIVQKAGKTASTVVKFNVKDAQSGVLHATLPDMERAEYRMTVYSPSLLSLPSDQDQSTSEILVGKGTFTPKGKSADVRMDIPSICARVVVNVRSESTDYSGWNLENATLTGPSAIAGKVSIDGDAPKVVSDESNSVFFDIETPTALRTKAQTVTFKILPSLMKGNAASLKYTLEKEGSRVEITHALSFPENSVADGSVTINETIPAEISGDWSAQGAGVKYTSVFPGKDWETTKPESRGYSSAKLEVFRKQLASGFKTTSLMIAVGGKVIFSYGDVTENVRIASCRKSLLSTLYGKYVENGTIDLNLTLRDLGIDEAEDSWGGVELNWDGGKLLESEKDATILDLITARSGCFHKPANSGDDHDSMKASDRGKYKHGEYFLYNNWDFNCAGGVFEMLTGQNIYAAFKEDIADPCGWQDFSLSNQKKTEEYKGASQFPAYHFWISTRDMLRMALLMMNKGNWDGKQVVSKEWAERITSIYTPRAQMHPSSRLTKQFDYGYLWWLFCKEYSGYDPDIFEGGFTATGSGGQYITVLPKLDMVLAHKDNTFSTNDKETLLRIVRLVAACKE